MNNTCERCNGTREVNSGRFEESGVHITLPCPQCTAKWDDLAAIGASWKADSSLEKWFPITAQELAKLKELNEDKFKTICAYCEAASKDKWKIERLLSAIDTYLSLDGYREASKLLTEARADVVNAR